MTGLEYVKKYTFEQLIRQHQKACRLLGMEKLMAVDIPDYKRRLPIRRAQVRAIEEAMERLYAGGDFRE